MGGGWGWWGGGQGGCERNVGGKGDVGYGGCEPRIEGIVQCAKKVLYDIKKIKNVGWGEGEGAIFEPKTLSMYLKKEKEKKSKKKTRIDVYETLCPQQMLVHKGGKIKNWGGECRDVTPTKSLSQNIRVDVNREVKLL